MTQQLDTPPPAVREGPRPSGAAQHASRTTSVPVLLTRVLTLGLLVGAAGAITPTLLAQERWLFLAAVWLVVGLVVATYATSRALPLKYLLPGTLFLVVLVVYPVLSTLQLSTTNYGDGTRTTKEQTVAQIVGTSVVQSPDAPRYNLSVATLGSTSSGPFAFLLVDPVGGEVFSGTQEGLERLPADEVDVTDGFVTEADGYTLLTPAEVNAAGPVLADLTVPTQDGAIRQLGIRQAFEGTTALEYDEGADTITDTRTGTTYTPAQQGDRQFFVDGEGNRLSQQSWGSDVGLDNYLRVFTDSRIATGFIGIFVWTVGFAVLSVGGTFAIGLALATVLNDPRVRGQRAYRSILLLPYAVPGFISLLVWASFWNRDFGLVNDLTGLDVNWFGETVSARTAVVVTNLWLGFPYMFLVCTGALQAIPADLKEAASLDGANGLQGFRRITFPLLLVAVGPLLVASFAFNFNNYTAIALLTEGGPFTPENPSAGGTDILISYTIRLAFATGGGGAQIGFAAAISVLLFILTGVIAATQFRLTRSLEDVH